MCEERGSGERILSYSLTSIQGAMLLCSEPASLRWDADTMTVGVEFLGVVKFKIWEWNKRNLKILLISLSKIIVNNNSWNLKKGNLTVKVSWIFDLG